MHKTSASSGFSQGTGAPQRLDRRCLLALAGVPLLKWGLAAITAIYLVRGLAIVPVLVFARAQATPFLVWSSIICIGYGVVHLVGMVQVWNQL